MLFHTSHTFLVLRWSSPPCEGDSHKMTHRLCLLPCGSRQRSRAQTGCAPGAPGGPRDIRISTKPRPQGCIKRQRYVEVDLLRPQNSLLYSFQDVNISIQRGFFGTQKNIPTAFYFKERLKTYQCSPLNPVKKTFLLCLVCSEGCQTECSETSYLC